MVFFFVFFCIYFGASGITMVEKKTLFLRRLSMVICVICGEIFLLRYFALFADSSLVHIERMTFHFRICLCRSQCFVKEKGSICNLFQTAVALDGLWRLMESGWVDGWRVSQGRVGMFVDVIISKPSYRNTFHCNNASGQSAALRR